VAPIFDAEDVFWLDFGRAVELALAIIVRLRGESHRRLKKEGKAKGDWREKIVKGCLGCPHARFSGRLWTC